MTRSARNVASIVITVTFCLLSGRVSTAKGRTDATDAVRMMEKFVAIDWSDSFVSFSERTGVTPQIGGVVSGSGLGVGLTHTLWHDARSAFGWQTLRTYRGYQDLGIFYTRALDARGRYALHTELRHRDLPQERLYGIGLSSRAADRTSFGLRENRLRTELGITVSPTVRLSVLGGLESFRARSGSDRSFPALTETMPPRSLPGFDETLNYGELGFGFSWDTRDNPRYARRGSFIGGELSRSFGLSSAAPAYSRLTLRAQRAVPLPKRDHAIVAQVSTDLVNVSGDASLPFFLNRGLGGSRTLRSYSLNRFRGEDLAAASVEYRHRIGRVDVAAFWDVGGVFNDFDTLSASSLRHSFGAGVRVLKKGRVLIRFDVAHGAEGTRAIISFGAPF